MIEGFSEEEIKLYLKGKTSEELSERIENAISKDEVLAQIVEAGRILYATAEREAIKKEISSVHNQLKEEGYFDTVYEDIKKERPNSNIFRLYIPYIAAASVLGTLFLLYFMLFNQKDIFRDYISELPDYISDDIELIAENRDSAATEQKYFEILEAMKYYKNAEYQKALKLLNSAIENKDIKYDKRYLTLYKAMSEIQLKNYTNAANTLTKIAEDQTFEYHNDVLWYLSYCNYKLNNKDDCLFYLKSLSEDSKYGSKATEIIKKLQ
jgi:uncharacterized protein YjgD (DUF1641 family)